MSEIANPNCPLVLFTPGPGDPHNSPHPMVTMPSSNVGSLTVIPNPGTTTYQMTFIDTIDTMQNPDSINIRIIAIAFQTAADNPTWWTTVDVPCTGSSKSNSFSFTLAQLGTYSTFWVGAWWANADFPATEAGIKSYFAHHPAGGNHHTVPIIIQTS